MEDAKGRKLHLRGSAIEVKYDDIERSLKNGSHARRVFCTSITNDDILMNDEKYKLDLPWIDQTPMSPADHGLVSPKGEQPESSRLHFNHLTL
ncbi:hypothetical protein T06_11486, partial [Trichinella sp. T6]